VIIGYKTIYGNSKLFAGKFNMHDPIAVIGFALKFPQDATSVDSFWRMLVEGRSARTEIPENRYNPNGFYHPDGHRTGSVRLLPNLCSER
jgi:hypothetical protein